MPDDTVDRQRRGSHLEVWLVGVVGFLVSWLGSWRVSLWTDEAVSISAARRSWSELGDLLDRIDAVHGAYYALLKLWTAVAGDSEVALRLPSAVAAGLTAVGVLVLARRLTSPHTAVVAALVCVVLPRMTWAGIEARPFVFSALAAVWATWAVVAAAEQGGAARWVRYGALAAAGVVTNIYLVMLVAGHGLTLLVVARRRGPLLGYALTAAAVAAVTMPVLLTVRSQQDQLGAVEPPGVLFVVRRVLVNQYFLGETPSDGVYGRGFDLTWGAAALLAAAAAAVLVLVALVRRPGPGADRRAVLAVALPWVLVPTLLVAAYAVLVAPVYQPRYLTFTAPGLALVLALGLRALPSRTVSLVAAVALLVPCVVVASSQRLEHSKNGSDWGDVAALVEGCASPGDAVLFEPRTTEAEDQRSSRRIAVSYPAAFAGLEDLTLRETGARTATLDGTSVPVSQVEVVGPTVWVLVGRGTSSDVTSRDAQVLQRAGYQRADTWVGPHTTVEEYTRDGAAGRLAAGCG